MASAIWPHGRWRLDFTGEANHAGTTRMADRHDPMLTFAYTVLAANKEARLAGAHATIGRVAVEPNATNAIAARVTAWLDARAADQSTLDALVEAIRGRAVERAGRDGTAVAMTAESVSPVDRRSTPRCATGSPRCWAARRSCRPGPATTPGCSPRPAYRPRCCSSATRPGSRTRPAEHATDADCAAGVAALAAVLEELACR